MDKIKHSRDREERSNDDNLETARQIQDELDVKRNAAIAKIKDMEENTDEIIGAFNAEADELRQRQGFIPRYEIQKMSRRKEFVDELSAPILRVLSERYPN